MGKEQSKEQRTTTTDDEDTKVKEMGKKLSRERPKADKAVDDERLLKIGLGVGKGSQKVEGNFQMGWLRRCKKKYYRPGFEVSCKRFTERDDE